MYIKLKQYLIALCLCLSTTAFAINIDHIQPSYYKTHDGQIEYFRFGHGAPLVFISGYATGVSSWNRELLTELAKTHEIILFDNRDIGGSQFKSPSYTSQDLANDTFALIHYLHLNKPVVIGISMGGMITQQVAALHENALGGIVLINTAIAGQQSVPPDSTVQEFILNTPSNLIRRYIGAVRIISPPNWRLYMAYKLAQDHFRVDRNETLNTPDAILHKQQKLILGWAADNKTAKRIASLSIPALILSGDMDQVIPPINSHILASTIPHATLYHWKNGGHVMIYQFPIQIAKAIDQFDDQIQKK